jgi:transcriptional regulator with XRE-family HTH domain
MPKRKPSLDTLGQLIVEKRGDQGVRAAAEEIGVSAATLSRVENGYLPDLENFRRICKWLDIDPNQILGFSGEATAAEPPTTKVRATVHFKKKNTTSPETAAALAQLILHVERALSAQD